MLSLVVQNYSGKKIKEKSEGGHMFQTKNFCAAKETKIKLKDCLLKLEEIFAYHTTEKELISSYTKNSQNVSFK